MLALIGSKLICALLLVGPNAVPLPEGGSAWVYIAIAAASCAVAVALKARSDARQRAAN